MSDDSAPKGDKNMQRQRDIADRLVELQWDAIQRFEKAMNSGFERECALCGHVGMFAPAGTPPRLDCRCPSCDCRERHRLFKLWIDREKRFTQDQTVLHFAPERHLSAVLRPLVGQYITSDRTRNNVDTKLDIEELDVPDDALDVIIAHQILEHVDHHRALAECFRCLRPSGFLVATFPIVEAWAQTYENPAITSGRDRFLHFGQRDHIKYLGRDVRDHMSAAGFEVEEYVSVEPDVSRYGLCRGETLFILNKPGPDRFASIAPAAQSSMESG
jgi:SAM-dependent methyltransferase